MSTVEKEEGKYHSSKKELCEKPTEIHTKCGKTIKVITLNTMLLPRGIHLVNPTNKLERAKKIAEWINASNADIVLLQEVFLQEAINIILTTCCAYESHVNIGFWMGSGLLTLSKIPILERREINIPYQGSFLAWYCEKPIQMTILQDGLRVYNLHLAASTYYWNNDQQEYEVLEQCRKLRTIILANQIESGSAWIVGGDFNYDRHDFIPAQRKGATVDFQYEMDMAETPAPEMDHVFCSGSIVSWKKFSCHSDHLGVEYQVKL
jgi:endonuclease/exonuclease/phosphatase family metal-dependent hydrolase